MDEMEHLVPQRDGRLAELAARPLELEEIVCLAIDALIQGNIVDRARGLARNGVGRAGVGPFSRCLPCRRPCRAPRRNDSAAAADPSMIL